MNTTDDVQTPDKDWANVIGEDYPGYSDDANEDAATEASSTISIDGFATASSYPDGYNSQVTSWIAALNTASSSAPLTSAAAPPPPPYPTGRYSLHLTETQDCEPNPINLFAIINLKDGAGNEIGDTSVNPKTDPIGNGINDGSSYTLISKLLNALVVTGEHQK